VYEEGTEKPAVVTDFFAAGQMCYEIDQGRSGARPGGAGRELV
jgi:hypothetical protein